jgi:spore maturation protein CgeB
VNKILFISGDGVDGSNNKWPFYYKYFDTFIKNYSLTKELKLMVNQCEILNFSYSLRHPEFILKLESLKIIGSTRIRLILIQIINFIIKEIIIRKIKRNNYDLIIFSDNLFFLNKTLIKNIIEFSTSKSVLFSGVSPKYYLPQSHKECLPYFDNTFISEYGNEIEWRDLGAQNVHVLPLSAGNINTYQKIVKKYNKREKYDIVFIGRLDGEYNDYRLIILDFLISNGVDINIWTWHNSEEFLHKYPLVKKQISGSAYGTDMYRIYAQSKIVLNMHNPTVWSGSSLSTAQSGGNMRLFEVPVTKTLQIADKCPRDWFKDGDEIVLFKDNKDLLDKVSYYLHDDKERLRIAHNGYKRLLKEHTYEHRMKKFLNIVQG